MEMQGVLNKEEQSWVSCVSEIYHDLALFLVGDMPRHLNGLIFLVERTDGHSHKSSAAAWEFKTALQLQRWKAPS